MTNGAEQGLKRTLGLGSLVFYGIGLIIGAGIYSVIGAAAGMAGRALWISFIAGSIAAAFTALSYAELATMFPRAGAEYVYLRYALPTQRWASFAIGFILIAASAATAATVSLAFGGYLNLFVSVPTAFAAIALLCACTALNIIGGRESSWINVLFTSIEVLGLVLVIAAGFSAPGLSTALGTQWNPGILPGAATVFFVYIGFERLANLAEEATAPARNLPRAILISLAATTLLYVLVAIAVLALVSPQALAASASPLATAVAGLSPLLFRTLGAIGMFATANTVLIVLIGASRLLYGVAEGCDLPAVLMRVLPGRHTPWVAALAMLVSAALFLPLGQVEIVASVSSFASLLTFAIVNVVLILLRYTAPDHPRPFRVPLAIGRLPLPALLGVLLTGGLLVQFDVSVYLVVLGVLVVGAALYSLRRRE